MLQLTKPGKRSLERRDARGVASEDWIAYLAAFAPIPASWVEWAAIAAHVTGEENGT